MDEGEIQPNRIRARYRASGPSRWLPGVAATLVLSTVLLILGRSGFEGTPVGAIMMLAVAFSAGFGRVRAGLLSALLAIGFFVVYFSSPDSLFHYSPSANVTVVVNSLLAIAMALMVGLLRRRSDLLAIERSRHSQAAAAERFRAEDTLKQFAELEAIIEGMPAGVFIGTEDGLSLCNRVGLQLVGYSRLADLLDDFPRLFELLDAHWCDTNALVTNVDHPFVLAMRGERVQRDIKFRRKGTGDEVIVRSATAPVEVDGRIIAAVSVNTDITERIRMVESIRENEESYRRLIDTAAEGIWIVAGEGRTTFANEQMARMLSETVENLIGRSIADYVHEEDRGLISRCIRERHDSSAEQHDIRLLRRDGQEFWAIISTNPMFDKNGKHIGTLGMFTDIADRKRAEAALEAIYAREHRIAETLQQSLLLSPAEIRFPGIEYDVYYQSALDEAMVGGDFFDAFVLEDCLTAFVVGDVSGKGLEAAAHTAEAKFTLRALLREYPSPAMALTRMNDVLCDKQRLDRAAFEGFVCLTVIVVNPATGRIDCASGGSESPVIVRSTGEAEPLDISGGMPLGIMARQDYDNNAHKLNQGDILVVTTDGLTEARQMPAFFGIEGLCAAAQEARTAGTLAEMARSIVDKATRFGGGVLKDDVCLLLVRRTAAATARTGRE